ncbi:hypothetical protein EI982_06610 [Haloplanus rallus]|jgi:hypothetical protein|uniref:Uncharacterized protein n=1 Tax=Haloplanus rallus TaxID=1816183 RepID=A0A6B9F2M1_9EURY|nr:MULTISPECIES: hypothetical protein [Haloplanus]QGX94478.1 hypothetical protein EI982_06610 [Haloplanus rallus]
MLVVESLYFAATAVLVVSGLTMVGMAIKAYLQTTRRAMIHVSLGFSLIAAAAIATAISAFINDFNGVRSLLLVNNGLASLGFIFVVYSLIIYD